MIAYYSILENASGLFSLSIVQIQDQVYHTVHFADYIGLNDVRSKIENAYSRRGLEARYIELSRSITITQPVDLDKHPITEGAQ